MSKDLFVINNFKHAKRVQVETGIQADAVLTQAALESGWGKYAVGNMYFGVKDTDGSNDNEQLLTTTEYHRSADKKYPVIISVTPCIINNQHYFKYRVKDYFRKYPSPYESFLDHANFLKKNGRYKKALAVSSDSKEFLRAIADAGYATDPQYKKKLLGTLETIQELIIKNNLV